MRGVIVGAAVVVLSSPAVGQPPPPAAKNAALQYLVAFQLTPRFDKSHPEHAVSKRVLDGWKTIPFTKDVIAHMDYYQTALDFLHRGAAVEECVWPSQVNADRDATPYSPQHDPRTLAVAARFRARYRFENDSPKAALADVFATLRLARHIESAGTGFDRLIADVVEAPAAEFAAAHLWALDRPSLCRDFLTRWDALPRPRTAADALRTERNNRIALFQRYRLDGPEPPRPDLLGQEVRREPADRLATVAFLAGRETEDQAVARFVDVVRRTYTRAAEIAELPLAEVKDAAAAWSGAFEELVGKNKTPDRHLLQVEAGCFLGCNPYRDRLRQERMTALRAMLRAAVAARLRGDDTPTENDPFGIGPFARTVTPTGYELRTQLNGLLAEAEKANVRCGGPVVLSVHLTRPKN